jgi:hypothetical protein
MHRKSWTYEIPNDGAPDILRIEDIKMLCASFAERGGERGGYEERRGGARPAGQDGTNESNRSVDVE